MWLNGERVCGLVGSVGRGLVGRRERERAVAWWGEERELWPGGEKRESCGLVGREREREPPWPGRERHSAKWCPKLASQSEPTRQKGRTDYHKLFSDPNMCVVNICTHVHARA